ncbi:MAG TPA: PQQ-binding-like beta-propeller repeat protein [Candidatus Limnocylindrales bacterium]|nr:PQQ-binding-like beta-propeller repeat protein [Candidatus Limnocylindrales bacterium]
MIIDLGDEWEVPVAEPDRPRWTAGLRPIAALIILVPVLVLGPADTAARAALTVRADRALASEDLFEFTGKEILMRSGRTVTVYEPDGRERWHVALSGGQDVYLQLDAARGRVQAMSNPMLMPRTVSLDLATGATVWQFNGFASVVDDLIFVSRPVEGGFAVYDATTLAQKWAVQGVAAQALDVAEHSVLSLAKDGAITEYRLATGDVIRSGRVDLPHDGLDLGIVGATETIIIWVGRIDDAQPRTFGFDRVTYAPRQPESPRRNSGPLRYDCGEVLCETLAFADQVAILDRETGQTLWRARPASGVIPTPAGLYAFPAFDSAGQPMELLDPRTGRRLASLQGWQPIVLDMDGYTGAAPVVLRPAVTTGGKGKTLVAGFDRTGLRVLGSISDLVYTCRYVNWMLACMSGDRHLIVVEINPALAGLT